MDGFLNDGIINLAGPAASLCALAPSAALGIPRSRYVIHGFTLFLFDDLRQFIPPQLVMCTYVSEIHVVVSLIHPSVSDSPSPSLRSIPRFPTPFTRSQDPAWEFTNARLRLARWRTRRAGIALAYL